MPDPVQYALEDKVAVVRLDDGKANALSHAVLDALGAALDRAEQESGAVLWVGRPGRFSGGFELSTMRGTPDQVRELVRKGAELFLRMLSFPRPIVVACTGHAVAAGAISLLSADLRLGTRGDFKIGLNEVGIGMVLPIFAFEIARIRVSKRHFVRATTQAELYDPDAAVDAGFLDRVVEADALFDAALAEARRLSEIPQPAFQVTKQAVHATALAHLHESLDQDMARLVGGPSR